MTKQEAYAGIYARLLSARISDQIKAKEFYAQAAVLGRSFGQAKTDLTRTRKMIAPPVETDRVTPEFREQMRGQYSRWVRKCLEDRIPVSQDLDSYCREILEVRRVEAKQPKAKPMPALGPSYSYHQYVSPRNLAD